MRLLHNFIIISIFFWLQSSAVLLADDSPAVFRQFPVMGTIAEIKLYGDEKSAKSAADRAQEKIFEIEKNCSIFNPESEISRLNGSAGREAFACSDLLWDILWKSKYYYEISGGSFDITAGPLMELWGFYVKRSRLPSKEEIDEARKLIGTDKLIFDEAGHSIKFKVAGMKLDLGGIAKGYAVDLAVAEIRKAGIDSGIVNIGGNLRCLPKPPPGKDSYAVGIRHPMKKDETCGQISVLDMSVGTSGNYEKYVEIEGKRFTHIMDPATAEPVAGMIAVTIVTPSATDTEGLSKPVFIKGEDFARKIIQKVPLTSILIIKESFDGRPEMIKIGDIWSGCSLPE